MTDGMDPFSELLGRYTGKDDKWGYHCNKCGYGMDVISTQTSLGAPKRMFFCRRKECKRFGVVTVVAKKKSKS